MNVRERIISIKLYNKSKSNPEITRTLGIRTEIKETGKLIKEKGGTKNVQS